MGKPLRLLIIEDSDRDIALEVRALEAAGYLVTYTVAATATEMKAALAGQAFDIVITDHDLPQFDAPGAQAVLKQSGLDIPFIVVSGTIGEEIAVALMKAGAQDYVMKDRLSRLASAVRQALLNAEERRGLKEAEEALRDSEEQFRISMENAPDGVFIFDLEGNFLYGNRRCEEIIGYQREELIGKSFLELNILTENSIARAGALLQLSHEGKSTGTDELVLIRKDGRLVPVEINTSAVQRRGLVVVLAFVRDVSERKLSEEKLLESYASLKKNLNDAINTIVKIVEMRDPYTAGHQHRVADLATAIAREMKLEDTRIDLLRTAALIHDIGKMNVPSDILSKPGRLSDMEFNLIKTHSQGSYDIIKGIDFPGIIAQTVLQHHERLDGSGYPNQLRGDDMLLEAKILAVADVIEAMASHRPYRPALGIDKALEEISKNKGNLYDPDVADTCLKLFSSGKFEFKPV